MQFSFGHKVFKFKQPSGTSRGVLTEKHAWFLKISDGIKEGIGECSVLPGLSPDFSSIDEYEKTLFCLQEKIETLNILFQIEEKGIDVLQISSISSFLEDKPSILFGLEMAILDFRGGGQRNYFENDFTKGFLKIPINGLIWMGTQSFLKEQILEKINKGFTCLKMKVGAIEVEEELSALRLIRERYPKTTVLRVDANGAFDFSSVLDYLNLIKEFNIHSIEQPIKAGNWKEMKSLIEISPIPIALDEELIGIKSKQKEMLLSLLKPHFIILKPSLHGGISGCLEWIKVAEKFGIGWWITSALESNIGLDCIAQFTAEFPITTVHGLGTGSLYVENETSALRVSDGQIYREL